MSDPHQTPPPPDGERPPPPGEPQQPPPWGPPAGDSPPSWGPPPGEQPAPPVQPPPVQPPAPGQQVPWGAPTGPQPPAPGQQPPWGPTGGQPPPPGQQSWENQQPWPHQQVPARAYQPGIWQQGWVPELGVQIGSAGRRIGAKAIDIVIIVAIQVILGGIVFWVEVSSDSGDSFFVDDSGGSAVFGTGLSFGLALLIGLIGLAIDFVYNVVLVARFGGTPGKLMLGLRIIRTDGSPVDTGVAFRRWALVFGLIVAGFLPIVGFFAGLGRIGLLIANLVMVLTDERRRDVFDRIANTYVISTS